MSGDDSYKVTKGVPCGAIEYGPSWFSMLRLHNERRGTYAPLNR